MLVSDAVADAIQHQGEVAQRLYATAKRHRKRGKRRQLAAAVPRADVYELESARKRVRRLVAREEEEQRSPGAAASGGGLTAERVAAGRAWTLRAVALLDARALAASMLAHSDLCQPNEPRTRNERVPASLPERLRRHAYAVLHNRWTLSLSPLGLCVVDRRGGICAHMRPGAALPGAAGRALWNDLSSDVDALWSSTDAPADGTSIYCAAFRYDRLLNEGSGPLRRAVLAQTLSIVLECGSHPFDALAITCCAIGDLCVQLRKEKARQCFLRFSNRRDDESESITFSSERRCDWQCVFYIDCLVRASLPVGGQGSPGAPDNGALAMQLSADASAWRHPDD